jgi:uncharacterized protein with LGFP repeats
MSDEVDRKYAELNGPVGFLGPPLTDERLTPNTLGSYRHYRGGSIYFKFAQQIAYEVHGLIRDRWAALGWENSFLGFPLTDEHDAGDGRGRASRFEGGSISWTPDLGAHEVHGAIHGRWKALGAPNDPEGVLGFPTTDELITPNQRGRYNHFEQGSIYWTPTTGAHEVTSPIRDTWADSGWENGPLGFPVTSPAALVSGTPTISQDFEHGTVYTDGVHTRVNIRNGTVVAGTGPVIGWSNFASTMTDGDWISFSCTGHSPFGDTKLALSAAPGISWWKGISLWSPSRGDLFEVSTEGTRTSSDVSIPPSALEASGLFLVFKKAKAFGAHTGMYWLPRPDKLIGNDIHFTWFHD